MPSQWTEGIDYEVLPDGKIKCLHCNKILQAKSGLGPHLSKCVKPAQIGPPKPEKVEEFGLDEKQNLVDTLKQFGIKYSEGLASFMEAYGFEDLNMLDECLRLAQVDPGKRKLIVSRWAHHVQKPVPLNLLEKWNQPIEIQPLQAFPGQQALTKEDLDKWYAERQKEQEIQSLRAELQELKQQLSEGNPKKASELEEIKKLLLEKERNEVLERLRHLEAQMGGISNIYSLLGLTIKETSDIIKNSPIRSYILTGKIPEKVEKEVEPEARERIFERLNRKYVVESD